MPHRLLIAAGLCLLSLPAAAQRLDLREWRVPYEDSRPRDPYAVDASEIWFVGQVEGYLARLNPQSGSFDKIDLPAGKRRAGPHNLVVGSDGRVWFAANLNGYIGVYMPDSGHIRRIVLPEAAYDPHTLIFDKDESHLFFTVQGGNRLGRLKLADEAVDLVEVPTPSARPYGIKQAPDGTVWSTLFGTNKLASLDPESLALREHALPRDEARPRRLAITDDDRIWYVDYAQGKLGVYDPATERWREWDSPAGQQARPYGMAKDGQGRLWYVETGPEPNMMIGFDPGTERFFAAAEIPSGGGTVRHMHHHAPTGTIWFGTDTNHIGRLTVPD